MPYRMLATLVILAASASTAAEAPSLGPKLQAKLKDRVAGEPVRCVPSTTRSKTSIVDRNALIFQRGSKTLYVNFPACPFLREDRALVIDGDKRRVCDGDEVMVVHLESDIIYGACRMGPFIPYTRAKG